MILQRIEPGPRFAQAVTAGDFVFLAGQVASDPSADVAGQTGQILAEIDRLLAAAGSGREYLDEFVSRKYILGGEESARISVEDLARAYYGSLAVS